VTIQAKTRGRAVPPSWRPRSAQRVPSARCALRRPRPGGVSQEVINPALLLDPKQQCPLTPLKRAPSASATARPGAPSAHKRRACGGPPDREHCAGVGTAGYVFCSLGSSVVWADPGTATGPTFQQRPQSELALVWPRGHSGRRGAAEPPGGSRSDRRGHGGPQGRWPPQIARLNPNGAWRTPTGPPGHTAV
jgi:hypothetical protein